MLLVQQRISSNKMGFWVDGTCIFEVKADTRRKQAQRLFPTDKYFLTIVLSPTLCTVCQIQRKRKRRKKENRMKKPFLKFESSTIGLRYFIAFDLNVLYSEMLVNVQLKILQISSHRTSLASFTAMLLLYQTKFEIHFIFPRCLTLFERTVWAGCVVGAVVFKLILLNESRFSFVHYLASEC